MSWKKYLDFEGNGRLIIKDPDLREKFLALVMGRSDSADDDAGPRNCLGVVVGNCACGIGGDTGDRNCEDVELRQDNREEQSASNSDDDEKKKKYCLMYRRRLPEGVVVKPTDRNEEQKT